eukprot:TRINITY_DN6474_c0_g1_i1.p2 TRINITY_DN6474_c0_g1~~TRINITY_DN6474_c0_g1_i1.p2  ORF type:complete len:126 (-),score=59.01 TRINITY_DN6474_c0_g1_i1:188-541(-)
MGGDDDQDDEWDEDEEEADEEEADEDDDEEWEDEYEDDEDEPAIDEGVSEELVEQLFDQMTRDPLFTALLEEEGVELAKLDIAETIRGQNSVNWSVVEGEESDEIEENEVVPDPKIK